jgi:hypothetical protein
MIYKQTLTNTYPRLMMSHSSSQGFSAMLAVFKALSRDCIFSLSMKVAKCKYRLPAGQMSETLTKTMVG